MNSSHFSVKTFKSISQVPNSWDKLDPIPTPMKRAFLEVVESSGINAIKPFYIQISSGKDQPVAQANAFVSQTDFSTFDSTLPAISRKTIKKWFPEFMQFRILEVGYFTMIGEGVALRNEEQTTSFWLSSTKSCKNCG